MDFKTGKMVLQGSLSPREEVPIVTQGHVLGKQQEEQGHLS